MNFIKILKAVFWKDFQIMKRYKLNLFMTLLSIIFYTIFIFFISDTFTFKDSETTDFGGDNLFIFLLTGLMLIDITLTCSSSLPLTVSFYQTSGILDELVSDTKIFFTTIICSTIFPFFLSLIKFSLYIWFAILFFNLDIVFSVSIFLIIPFMFIYLFAIIGIGLIAASLTLIFKRGNPVIQLNNILTATITGAFIPVTQFATQLQAISDFLPATQFISILRVLFQIDSYYQTSLNAPALNLIFLSIIIFTFGVISFYKATNYAKLKNIIADY